MKLTTNIRNQSWQKHLNESIKTYEDFVKLFGVEKLKKSAFSYILEENYRNVFNKLNSIFKFQATRYYLNLANLNDPLDPILLQILPQKYELDDPVFYENDPLKEEIHSPIPNLVHRYPDRVLWYLHHHCAVYCRFCMRKRKVSHADNFPFQKQKEKIIEYIQNHKNIKEVILSGGDPLTISDENLENILVNLKKIPHIFSIRIHSRIPVTLPHRITKNLCRIFKKFYPLTLVTHFNHPVELTPLVYKKIKMLRMNGVLVLNQSVFLKNINDNISTMENLLLKLIQFGIKPYYLHHCDEVKGTYHFRTKLQKGIELLKSLQGKNPGIMLPRFVVDLPEGGGKIPVQFDYFIKKTQNQIEFNNYKLEKYKIQDF